MNTKNIACRVFVVIVAVASLVMLATADKANAAAVPASDELLISVPGGPSLFDTFIPEPALTAVEAEATFAGGPASVPPPVPLAAVIGLPGTSVVVLTEPAGAIPDPGEVPIVIAGPNGNIVVSDLIMSTLGNPAGAPPFITLVSDGNPDLAQLVPLLPAATVFLPEAGLLQDLTTVLPPAVFPAIGPITIQVRSDVNTPEPSGVVLAGLGLVGVVVWRCRRRRR